MSGDSGRQTYNASDIKKMEKAWDEATETDLVRIQIAINFHLS
jgi:hypothetical protein